MRIATISLVFGLLLSLPTYGAAETLDFNSLAALPSGNGQFSGDWISARWGAENFSLSVDATIREVSFTALHDTLPQNNPTAIDWRIYSWNALNPRIPGTRIAGANSNGFATNYIRHFSNLPISEFIVTVPDLFLPAGSYWIAFHVDAAVMNMTYWATADDGDGLSAVTDQWSQWHDPYPGTDMAFAVRGQRSTPSVPEPSIVSLLATFSVGLLTRWRLRKHLNRLRSRIWSSP